MIIPMAPPLRSHIESLPAGDNPQGPLHSRAFAILSQTGNASILSGAFSDLLVQAGLRAKPPPRDHRSRGIGHSGRRRINELSFHSLRRTATTLLHEAGVPPTVAQALIGHDSEEVHHDYIGIGREALRNAVQLMNQPSVPGCYPDQHPILALVGRGRSYPRPLVSLDRAQRA